MDATAHDAYLTTQVLTATPQRLQLMLVEGAIRFGQQVLDEWSAGNREAALEALQRCRRIVTELLAGVDRSEDELPRKVRSVYFFLFRTLTEAQLECSEQKVRDVLSVLEIERQTWQQACERFGATRLEDTPAAIPPTSPAATVEGFSMQA